ncbi:MAG: cysteate synthase [Deltaproteobacteria bacterium]|nr:cysteate synthase [Deltaproteobacteria bacterium]
MSRYQLKCLHADCGQTFERNDAIRLTCEGEVEGRHSAALLRPVYPKAQIEVRPSAPGIFAFDDWLPTWDFEIRSPIELGRPFCYRSTGLARRLGLSSLYIAFSGFWPERGPNLLSRSFKEFEAQATLARFLATDWLAPPLPLVISSAGNTANGFNLLSTLLDVPLYLVVPETGLHNLVLPIATHPFVVVVRGDYASAIEVADRIAGATGLLREGGARNVARRAGMGSVMLNAVAHPEQGSGRLFDHYFQAVGSGTGAIAAWESVLLLLADGRFGSTRTRIHVAQNAPYTPIVDAWRSRSKTIEAESEAITQLKIASVTAPVLTNRHPPYSLVGGMRDVLMESEGGAWAVTNFDLFHAARMFRECEGIDIGPAAAAAVDALHQAVRLNCVAADESVLLHVTGGGREIQQSGGDVFPIHPRLVIEPKDWRQAVDSIGHPAPVDVARIRERARVA